MHRQRGVSLVEVLVATVLLAVGVTGTLASLAAAGRLRESARGREEVAAAMRERLAWFEAMACRPETASGTLTRSDGVRLTWTVAPLDVDSVHGVGRRTATLVAEQGPAPRTQRLALHTARPCD